MDTMTTVAFDDYPEDQASSPILNGLGLLDVAHSRREVTV